MTTFATARRHKLETLANSVAPAFRVDPRHRPTAADKLKSGMQNLASLQTTVRQKVTLPRIPGSAPLSRSASPAVPSPYSTRPSTPSTHTDGPIAATLSLTPAAKAEIERTKLKLDRLAAEKEWADYMAAGVVTLSDKPGAAGLNLVHFWDVSFSFTSFTIEC